MGAPKSGTTSLAAYLDAHPQTCMTRVKETYFLADRDSPNFNWMGVNVLDHGLDAFGQLFECAESEAAVYFEACPGNMYAKTALQTLTHFPVQYKLIFILREPARRTYSAFRFHRDMRGNTKKQISFREAIFQPEGINNYGSLGSRVVSEKCNVFR